MACMRKPVFIGVVVVTLLAVGIAGLVLFLIGDEPDLTATAIPYLSTSPATTPSGRDSPMVAVEQGFLEGEWRRTSGRARGAGKTYAAFLGVPYAAPPVRNLRFKAPRPAASWDGVRPAKSEAPACAQSTKDGLAATGSEDCLYLNVFSPRLPSQDSVETELLPVYFFIHGGKFLQGSTSTDRFGHDFLVEQDVVVVTVQYRLNSFGFASLDSEAMPGNAAVKDALAALQWVHRNAHRFSGDAGKITVGGQSAGSGLAGWLTVLPDSAKLMRGAILQSGSAYHSWAYKEDHVAMALRLASLVARRAVDNATDAERILMAASAEELTLATGILSTRKLRTQPELPYQPTPEKRRAVEGGEPLLITKDAESYFFDPEAPSMPQIVGVTNKEWRFYYYGNNPTSDPEIDQNMFDDLAPRVPKNLIPFNDTKSLLGLPDSSDTLDDVMEQVKDAIRKEITPACDLSCILKEYYDDIWMATDTQRLGAWRAHRQETTYLFRFGVRTELNSQFISPLPKEERNTAVHGDDLPYLWYRRDANQTWDGDSTASLVIRRVVTMWANFIKHGKPTLEKTELLPVAWAGNEGARDNVTFLDIGPCERLTLRTGHLSGRMIPFWNALYAKYRTKS